MTNAPMALVSALFAASPAATGVLVHEQTPISIVQFVPADGGPPVRIAPETGHGYGRRGGQVDIFGVHPASGTVLLLWTPQDTLFRDLFAVHADGRDADAPRLLVPGVNIYAKLAFSPDGRSVLTATREAIVRVDVDGGPVSVLSRLPAPVRPSGRREDAPLVSLAWTPAGAMVELRALGRAPESRLIPWDSAAVAFDALPAPPISAPPDATAGKRRFVAGSTTLVLEGPWEAHTVHRLRADGALGPALGPPLNGEVVSAPDVGRIVARRGDALVSFALHDDRMDDERVLIPAVSRYGLFRVVPGAVPRAVAHPRGDGALVSVPVTGGPPSRLAVEFEEETARVVAGGFAVSARETRSALHAAIGAGPAQRVQAAAEGSVMVDDWSPDHLHYVWATHARRDAEAARLFGFTVGDAAVRTLATGAAHPAGFAAGWLLVDRSPSVPPEMVRLDEEAPVARPTGLAAGFVVLRGRAEPPGWVALSRSGELWAVPVDARGPGPAKRVAEGLVPGFGFELAGDRAVALRADPDGRRRIVAVTTAGRKAGRETTLYGPASGNEFALSGEPADGQMLVFVPARTPPAVREAMVLELGVEPRLRPLPEGFWPIMDPGAWTLSSDAGGQRLLARNAAYDLYSLTWGHSPRRLLPAGPHVVVFPPPFSGEAVHAVSPVAWPAISPTGKSLVARGTELWRLGGPSEQAPVRVGEAPQTEVELFGSATWAWSPDGRWAASAAQNRVSFLGQDAAAAVDVALDADVSEAWVAAWRLAPAAALVVAVAPNETRLVAVPPPGAGEPVTLIASPDGVPRVADVFGPGYPWRGRRAPTMRSRVGLEWFEMAPWPRE